MKRLFHIGIRPSSAARLCRIPHPIAGLENREDVSKAASLNGSADLRFGLGFNQDINGNKRRTLPKEARELCDKVPKEWILCKDQLADGGWIALKKIGHDLRARPEKVKLSKGSALENEIAGTFLKFFHEKRDKVVRANKALTKLAS